MNRTDEIAPTPDPSPVRERGERFQPAHRLDRRKLLGTLGGGLIAAAAPLSRAPGEGLGVRATSRAADLAIDLSGEPPTLDPALIYEVNGWSVVHSIYDALVQYGPDGTLEPLLAESLTWLDPLTYEIKLRQGVLFHNGEPFDARSVAFSVAHLVDPETKSQVAGNFAVIETVEEVDPATVRFKLSQPAPWLPAQMAAWLLMLPPDYAADPANDFANNPIGTGPYRFVGWERGSQIKLEAVAEADSGYFGGPIKGEPIADRVAFRFVPEASTRVADLLAGTAQLVRGVPVDQLEAVRGAEAQVVVQPISGSAWVRVPSDVAPFDDARVRLALDHAVDVDAIVQALLAGEGTRLPNFFVEGGLGYDSNLAPHAYDPDLARSLLSEAGYPDGFDTTLAYTTVEREDVVQAVAGMLTEVGVRVELQPVETATFNATWQDPATAPLRFATWRPLFDPYTLLSLIVSNQGFLSRYDSPNAQPLIDAGATEADPEKRAAIYRELGRVLHDEPAAIYLFSLTSFYGLAADVPAWTTRPDDYIIPTAR